ncbi:ECF RNA polymerase sigma factor SigK [Tenggerimyces flavus]|uniref:ECF RNA polymerase sigma factor SigK n=1 Tax=Tenggerimyces flavus TaxID=1708749 RepID=A0ABV7YCP4_9ACTN|nr:ECF RNA polymerase sigma factor SigK [Tenggerimyces flavus]MBM7789730.1 RNA polymerase sigma-70 factor (ECF subfamily) [Tenggerimyces flavus]
MATIATLRRLVGMRDADPTPEELLSRAARGDEAMFALLYDRLAPPVFSMIVRLVRNHALAEEITQDVFVELWRTATRFDASKGTALAWAMTMAHRRAVDRIRSEQAMTDRERRAAASAGAAEYDSVVEEAVANLEHQQVRGCLGSLTDLQREAVTLAYYGGYTYHEVANLLQANLATVKTRMRDGLVRLRDCLGVETTR